MTMSFTRARLLAAGGLLLAGTALIADGTRFSDFTPLVSSAGPTIDESAPSPSAIPPFGSGPSRTAMRIWRPSSPTAPLP